MPTWLILTIIAYFFLAVANLGDKFLISKIFPSSKIYAFLIGLMSLVVFVAAPWGLAWPGWPWFLFNLAVGALFPWALLAMFNALKHGDTSRITILIGSTIPIFTFVLSLLLLGEHYSGNQILGLIFLIAGSLVIVAVKDQPKAKAIFASAGAVIWPSLISAAIFALYFIGTKFVYEHQPFLSSYIWLAGGNGLMAALFLAPRAWRQEILSGLGYKSKKRQTLKQRVLLIGNQILGGLGSLIQHYAIFFGPVAIINALQGVQYVFLILGGWLLTIFYPKILKENITAGVIAQKIMAIIIIAAGFYLLTIN
jgi:drug/metabolite transporter (DMT)-like permease